jgi:hypothetical protein
MNKNEEIMTNILEMIKQLQTLVEINNKKIIKLETPIEKPINKMTPIEKPINKMTTKEEIEEIFKNFNEMKEQYYIVRINNKLHEQENLLSYIKRELEREKDYIKYNIHRTMPLTITDKINFMLF